MNPELLLERAKSGAPLSDHELTLVRAALAASDERYDPYTLVHIIWKSRDRSSKDLLLAVFERLSHGCYLRRRLGHDAPDHRRASARRPVRSRATRALLARLEQQRERSRIDWESAYAGLLNLVDAPASKRPWSTRPLRVSDLDPDILQRASTLAGAD